MCSLRDRCGKSTLDSDQFTAGRKRTKIGDTEIVQDLDDDDDPRPSRSVRAYLGLLFTLSVGYARSACQTGHT